MRTVRTIQTQAEDIGVGLAVEEDGEYLVIPKEMSYEKAAKQLACSPQLVELLCDTVDFIRDQVRDDLQSIWKRLDAAGIE